MNTVTEACALNQLLSYILKDKGHLGIEIPTSQEACRAAALLAEKARKTGASRYSGDQVKKLWKEKQL